MSIKAISWVWQHSKQKSTKLLMLLALADSCDDDGVCYPGIKYLAKKTRVSHDRASKILKDLRDAGEIRSDTHQGVVTSHGNTNRYYLLGYRKSIGEETDKEPENSRGVENDPPGGLDSPGHEGLKVTPYPLGEPSEEPKDLIASPDGNAAGDVKPTIVLIADWNDVIREMTRWENELFHNQTNNAIHYLLSLYRSGKIEHLMEGEDEREYTQQVLAIVKRELALPEGAEVDILPTPLYDKSAKPGNGHSQQWRDIFKLRCIDCGKVEMLHYTPGWLADTILDNGWNYDGNILSIHDMVCPGCIERRIEQSKPSVQETKPKPERKPNPWYDAVKATMGVEGFKNGNIVNTLRSQGKKDYAKYDLEIPLTDPEQIYIFWAWYQTICPGCSLVSPATVQDYVMRWQASGMPDVNKPQREVIEDDIEWVLPSTRPVIQYADKPE